MDKARLGWVVFSYFVLGGAYLLLGYITPALDQMLSTAITLTFLFSSFFLAFQGYRAATTSPPGRPGRSQAVKTVKAVPVEYRTCRCGRRFVKTQSKQSECANCFVLSSMEKVFPR